MVLKISNTSFKGDYMRKVFISVQEVIPGMQIAETIFNDYGAVIVSENTILDTHIIRKLINLDISKIRIYDQESNIINANDSELFRAQYNENVEVIKDVLHDIGKGKIPQEILNKPGTLSDEEYAEIKKHPVYGCRILETMPEISKDVSLAVLMHHEREDGSGYPVGMKGESIHQFAKIIAVADIYDAMTSNRVYREKGSPFDVFELMESKTFGVFDPVVVNAFLNNIAAYYIGDFVRLSNGMIGEVVYINPRHISQPIVRVNNTYVDLTVQTGVKIAELMEFNGILYRIMLMSIFPFLMYYSSIHSTIY